MSCTFFINRSVSSESFRLRLSTSSSVRDRWSTSRVRFRWAAKSSSRLRLKCVFSSSSSSFFLFRSLFLLTSFFRSSIFSRSSSISLCNSLCLLSLTCLSREVFAVLFWVKWGCLFLPLYRVSSLWRFSLSPPPCPSLYKMSFILYNSFLFSISRVSLCRISLFNCICNSVLPQLAVPLNSLWPPIRCAPLPWLLIKP